MKGNLYELVGVVSFFFFLHILLKLRGLYVINVPTNARSKNDRVQNYRQTQIDRYWDEQEKLRVGGSKRKIQIRKPKNSD